MNEQLNINTIVYHKNCPDGIAGLWCGYEYNERLKEKNILSIIPMHAGIDLNNDMFEHNNTIFIDVCPLYNFILVLTNICEHITILDHHKSAYDMYISNKDVLDNIPNLKFIFDMERSGCQIAWDYFFEGERRPWFIDYVGDRDLWKWELDNSKEICSAINFLELLKENNLNEISKLLEYDTNKIDELVKLGENINLLEDKLVNDQAKYSLEYTMKVKDKEYHIQVGSISGNLISKLGNNLTKKVLKDGLIPDFSLIWNYDLKNDTFNVSLRGHDLSPDLSKIAKHFGGGGHAKASGFKLEYPQHLRDILINYS